MEILLPKEAFSCIKHGHVKINDHESINGHVIYSRNITVWSSAINGQEKQIDIAHSNDLNSFRIYILRGCPYDFNLYLIFVIIPFSYRNKNL